MKIGQIISEIEEFAPLCLQESFDNSGLQVGDPAREVEGILIALDTTEEVIDEAIDLGCNLVITHHPLLFKPLKQIAGRNYIQRCTAKALKNDVAVYACHTNLDNAAGGVNYRIAEKLGLQNIRILSPKTDSLIKLSTFVPTDHAETVRNALFRAGAGCIGNYDSCSFNASGEGTFRGDDDAQPFVGEPGEFHTEPEIRIETILPAHRKAAVVRAMLSAHPYEEPAFDLYPLVNEWQGAGFGAVGQLPDSEDEETFLQRLKSTFNLQSLRHSPLTGKRIREIAICGGSGAFLIPDAIAYGADAFITGEARYNDFYDVENRILLAVIGHYESEISTNELIYDIISKKITNFAVRFSTVNLNPVKYL